ISITPATSSIPLGKSQQFMAAGTYTDGTTKDLTTTATWTSSAANVAGILGGLAVTAAQGTTTITATVGTVAGSASLSVTAPVLRSISITPATSSVPSGNAQQLM